MRGQIIQSKSQIFQLFVWIPPLVAAWQGMIGQIAPVYTAGEALVPVIVGDTDSADMD